MKDLRDTIRLIHTTDSMIELRNLAEKLQHQAFSLKDWAQQSLENRDIRWEAEEWELP